MTCDQITPASAAFRAELSALAPRLRPKALKLCLNPTEAQDLIQDTMVRALRFESSYRPGTNMGAWVNQILFSVFVTRCRKYKRERKALDNLVTDPCSWTKQDAKPAMNCLTPRLEAALGALPSPFEACVRLVDLNDLSYKEAAARLEVPVGTVMSRLFRGRRLLQARLGPQTEALAA